MNAFQTSEAYLASAKRRASANGYDPRALDLARDGTHKLVYQSPMGKVKFGRLGYGDHIYYSKFEPEIAEQKRNTFQKSHGAISRIHNLGKYSANELALNILW
jgi:hypothetical protein